MASSSAETNPTPPAPTPPEPASPAVSILIVGFRSKAFILECIASIEAHCRAIAHEIRLINNSDDDTEAAVAALYPHVRIVPSEGNIGFGAANNRLAAAARAPRLLLLNPDTKLKDDAVAHLFDLAALHPDAGAWGGQMVSSDGVADTGVIIPTIATLAKQLVGVRKSLHWQVPTDGGRAPMRVDVLSGGFMMVPTKVWRRLGGFDESFFLYSEEVDLFLRMRQAGLAVWMTPNAEIVHYTGSGDAYSLVRVFYKTVGQAHFARKHWGPIGSLVGRSLIWALAVQRWAGGMVIAAVKGHAGRRAMQRAYKPIVSRPWRWWKGYAGRTSVRFDS